MGKVTVLWQFTWFLLVPLSAAFFGCVAGLVAWPRRDVPGAKAFLLCAAATVDWGALNALEIAAVPLALKLVFFDLKFVGLTYAGPLLFISMVQYTGRRRWLTRPAWVGLLGIPFFFLLVLWTDRLHGAFMARMWLSEPEPYIALKYQQTVVSGAIYFCVTGITYITVLLVAWSVFGASTVHPLQVAVASGVLVMLTVFTPFAILGFNPVHHTDLGPMVVGLGQAAFAAAFFNKRVYGIIPGTRATLYESLRDGILVLDAGDRVIEVWPAAERLLGTNRADLLGRPIDGVLAASFETVADSGAAEGRLMRSRTEERYVELGKCPLRTKGADSEGELILLHDVTKRRRSEEESRRLEAQIQRAQKLESLGRLSGGVAHDFNNILTIVLLNAELARDAEEKDTIDEHLENIEQATSRAVELVRQLLAFSRTPQVEMKPLRMGKAIADAVKMISETFDRRIRIEAHVHDKLPPVLGNKAQMEQVLLNLCINARDAIEEAQGTESLDDPHIALLAEAAEVTPQQRRLHGEAESEAYVCLSVSDTGAGMDAETKRQVFEPFFTTKEVGKGTGLGLAIVYGIIRQHKGWIEVTSEPGAGSTFRVYLPAMTSAEPEQEALAAETLAPRGSGTVLLVDDEELILKAGRAMLGDLGYTPLTASNGPEAVRIFEEQFGHIAAVILDLSMPEMSGYEVLQRIRRIHPKAKVLIASGYSTAGLAEPLEDMASAFVPKPYHIVDIARALRKVIDEPD